MLHFLHRFNSFKKENYPRFEGGSYGIRRETVRLWCVLCSWARVKRTEERAVEREGVRNDAGASCVRGDCDERGSTTVSNESFLVDVSLR